MKELKELAKNSVSNTAEYSDEYIRRARILLAKREEDEKELRQALPPVGGRDDRLSVQLHHLDIQLRSDISELRKEFNID